MTAFSQLAASASLTAARYLQQRSFYIDVRAGEAAFVVVQDARPDARRDCAVVLCPPFGWEELAAHRMLGVWARQLADAGYVTARLTYPGMGDSSSGPTDPDRLGAWVASIQTTASWLRRRDGVSHVVAIGIGFGGLVAQLAFAQSAEVTGAVLWSTPRRGHDVVRQLRAFSRLEMDEAFSGLPNPPPLADGALEAGGFLMTAETTAALRAVDLSTEPLAHQPKIGILLLGRDARPPDETLRRSLVAQGVDVTTAVGSGYVALSSHPQDSILPNDVTNRVRAWLDERTSPASADRPMPVPAGERAELLVNCHGGSMTERPVNFTDGDSKADLAGIFTEPATGPAPVCAIFVNAGAIHRIGPNRMYVDMARRWGALGVASLRIDLRGIGEAGGPDRGFVDTMRLHEMRMVDQIASVLDELERLGVAKRFMIVGLCSGAYWALQLVLRDPRVISVQLLNLAVIEWDENLGPSRTFRAISPRSLVNIRRVDTRKRLWLTLRWLARRLRARLSLSRAQSAAEWPLRVRIGQTLERLRDSGKPVLVLFAAREPLELDLVRDGLMDGLKSCPNVTVVHVPVVSHTLRPQWAQARTGEIVDSHLGRVLAQMSAAGSPAEIRRNPQGAPQPIRSADPTGLPK